MTSLSAMDWIGITPYPIALLIAILVLMQVYFAKRGNTTDVLWPSK